MEGDLRDMDHFSGIQAVHEALEACLTHRKGVMGSCYALGHVIQHFLHSLL